MSYINNVAYNSGSTSFSGRSPTVTIVESPLISASLNSTYTIISSSKNPGRLLPYEFHFYYKSVGTNAATACRYHLGYTAPNYNDYISSGTLNGVTSNVFTNTQPTFLNPRPMSGSNDLVFKIVVAGNNVPTGSVVLACMLWDN